MARLSDLWDQGLDVEAWCERCNHHAVLAASMLAIRLRPEVPVPQVARRLRCSVCGSTSCSTRPAWPRGEVTARHG